MGENLLAILDSASDSKHTLDANDDRIEFLEVVHSSCIVNETPPTKQFPLLLFIIVLDPSKQVLAHHASELKKNKGLMKDCLSTMHGLFEVSAGVSEDLEPPDDSAAKLIGYCFRIC